MLDKALGIEVPIDKPIPPPLPPPLPMTPLYDKFLPLPTKPKVTMENLKDWVDKMEAMPGPNQGQTRSTERLKKRFLPMSSPVPTKISDLNMSIKRVALKSPDGKTGTSPKVVKIVKMDKSSGSENPTKSVIKIVKPPSADLMTNLESSKDKIFLTTYSTSFVSPLSYPVAGIDENGAHKWIPHALEF